MPDTQIYRGSVAAVPKTYVLPSGVEFLLKAVNADFDGSGAGGAYLPCVEIVSDSGHVIARAVDQGVSVAAGASAEVSFFPRVGRAGGGIPGVIDYLLLLGAGQTVTRPPVGDSDHSKFVFATRQTNNDASWTYILDAGGAVKEVDTTVPGRYQSICQFEWGVPAASSRLQVVANIFGAGPISMSPFVSLTTTTLWAGMVQAFTNLPSGTAQFTIEPAIPSGDASLSYDADYWWIFRYPL